MVTFCVCRSTTEVTGGTKAEGELVCCAVRVMDERMEMASDTRSHCIGATPGVGL
jgi:hypothetical protein